jgi:hypothetical protein
MHAGEEVELIRRRLEQRESEQGTRERHGRPLDRQCDPMDLAEGIARPGQVMDFKGNTGIVDRCLENLAVGLKTADPDRLGLFHNTSDRPLERVTVDCAGNFYEQSDLPFCAGMTCFMRKPYVELAARQRQCAVNRFHSVPPPTPRALRNSFA